MNREEQWLKERSETVMLSFRPEFEIRRSGIRSFLFHAGSRICEFSNGSLIARMRGSIFVSLEKKMKAFWKRQIEVAALSQFAKIKSEWRPAILEEGQEYSVWFKFDRMSTSARVHFGKRFRVVENR
ncbi:MAG: hypothetical protein QW136_00075 [Nitrososphaerales archaeon]